MVNIEQLIYNKLSLQQGVNLLGLGSLRVESRPAKFVSKTDIQAPYAQVVFSRKSNSELYDIVELMFENSALAHEECERQYKQWLEQLLEQKTVVINGVGTIKSDFFTPSAELDKMLNPFAGEVVGSSWNSPKTKSKAQPKTQSQKSSHKSRSRSTNKTKKFPIYWLFVVAALIAAIVIATLSIDFTAILSSDETSTYIYRPDVEVSYPEEKADSLAVDTVDTQPEQVAENKTVSDVVVSSTVSTTLSPFHVIAGMYSTDANADAFIASSRKELGDTVVYEKIARTSGKILISIYAAQSHQEALDAARKFENPNLWVFSR